MPVAIRYGAAVFLCVLAQAVRLPLHPPTLIPFITFVPFMLLIPAFGGLGPGLLGTALCTLESMYFATEPIGDLRVANPQHWTGIAALALTGVVASFLFDRFKRAWLELATIQSHAPVMLLVLDDKLRVHKANELALRFGGRNVPETLGLGPGGAIGCLNALADPRGCGHGPACAGCEIRLAAADTLRHGTPHHGVEAWVPVSVDGSRQARCLQISTVPMQLPGTNRSILICAQDTTEHKRAEERLLRQAQLIDLSHDAIILADENRVITGWNTGAVEMYGWTQEEAVGKVTDRLLETSNAIPIAGIDAFLGRSGRWDGELVQTRRDGARKVVDSRQVLLRDASGNPTGILEINRDITEAKRARQELVEAHRRTTAILESVSDGFAVFDREWRYTYVNPAAARMVRKPREELLGKNVWDLWPHAADSPFGAAYRRAVEENIPVQVEAFYPDPLNAWFEVRCCPSPEGLSLFYSDVTARKRAEEEIRSLNSELEQRVRDRTAQLEAANQELESFAHSVSHDLRAPLRGIDGWSLALVEDFGSQLNEEARHYLGRVRSEAQHMGRLIDDLLRLSRITRAPLARDSVDLTELAECIASCLRETHADRQLEFAIQRGLTAQGDARLLEVALTNLLGNAVKFTGQRADARIEFHQIEQEGQPVLCVRDNGVGFDMTYAGALFGAFQRLHRASEFPGTGIGLATVQRVIHRHGGRVWADAQVGQGATFYFTLGRAIDGQDHSAD